MSKTPNLEANLVYIIDSDRVANARKLLDATFPESEFVDLEADVKWKPQSGEGEDEVGEEVLLPLCFGNATYDCDAKQHATICLSVESTLPAEWELLTDGDNQRFWGEQEWLDLQTPNECVVKWKKERPPSGFWVRWNPNSIEGEVKHPDRHDDEMEERQESGHTTSKKQQLPLKSLGVHVEYVDGDDVCSGLFEPSASC